MALLLLASIALAPPGVWAFSSRHHPPTNPRVTWNNYAMTSRTTKLHAAAPPPDNTCADLKAQVLEAIAPTKRGLSATAAQKSDIETRIRLLEASCPLSAPARDPRMGGMWDVLYTTAPPPSNGQLGPFVGVARQFIDLEGGGYQNILQVGESNWLSAVLDAEWMEWDGTLLIDKGGGDKWREAVVELEGDASDHISGTNEEKEEEEVGATPSSPLDGLLSLLGGKKRQKEDPPSPPDYGATSWKVDFKTITFSLFGRKLFEQTFPEGTARVWKMIYLDDDTRVVRAGRTGKAADDVVFYMVRGATD